MKEVLCETFPYFKSVHESNMVQLKPSQPADEVKPAVCKDMLFCKGNEENSLYAKNNTNSRNMSFVYECGLVTLRALFHLQWLYIW